MWSQWEKDSAWSDSLMRSIETSFPKIPEGSEQESEKPLSYKVFSIFYSIYKGSFLLINVFFAHRIYYQAANWSTEHIKQCSILSIWASSMLYFVHCTQNLIRSIKYTLIGCFFRGTGCSLALMWIFSQAQTCNFGSVHCCSASRLATHQFWNAPQNGL